MTAEDPFHADALHDLARFLEAIEGYLDKVVLCGGWASFFYRHLSLGSRPSHGPLFTHDFDLVSPPALPQAGVGSLSDCLSRANFVAIRNREPPVVFYQHERWGTEDRAPVYGEFLTPLEGPETDRSGQRKTVRELQDGVTAQRLRYLDLLLHEPLGINTAQVPSLKLTRALEVSIPNPAAYVFQKALALKRRSAAKQLKDFAYVFEVATLWFHEVARVQEMAQSIASKSHEWSRWVEKSRRTLLNSFKDKDSDGPVSVERVLAATPGGHLVSAATAAGVVSAFVQNALT